MESEPAQPARPAWPMQQVHWGAIAAACLGAGLPLLAILVVLAVKLRDVPPAPPSAPDTRPRIVLVIDDAGLDPERSARAIRLQSGVTLSFLPYAPQVREQIDAAREAGHEVLAHVPMQPLDERHDPGPHALRVGQSPEEVRRSLAASLSLVPPVVGINNHMGSRFTRDPVGMNVLFAELAQRGLLFLDSRTSERTEARISAQRHGVPYAERDVFLDHVESAQAVKRQLELLERQARDRGIAVGIGHPRDVTLEALEKWLPELDRRGFALVPLSTVVQRLPAPGQGAASVGAKAR